MKLHNKESNRFVEVVLKALEILDCFSEEPALSLRQIMDRTGLARSRTMRITGTLISRGYLFFDPVSGNYTLGSRLLSLGNAFEHNNSMLGIVRPILKHLVEKTGESSTFSIVEAEERVVLAREEGIHNIRYTIREGQRMPLHAGAASKALLAFGPKEVLESVLGPDRLEAITPKTITDINKLKKSLAEIRKQGFAESTGENTPGSQAMAAPVFDYSNRLVGVLSVSGPSNRLQGSILDHMRKEVIEASKMLSEALGNTNKT